MLFLQQRQSGVGYGLRIRICNLIDVWYSLTKANADLPACLHCYLSLDVHACHNTCARHTLNSLNHPCLAVPLKTDPIQSRHGQVCAREDLGEGQLWRVLTSHTQIGWQELCH